MNRATRALGVMLLCLLPLGAACRRQPQISSETYGLVVTAFHVGVAALQTSQDALARRELERVTSLAPHEPAGWANLGLLLLRQQQVEMAAAHLATAGQLAPDHAPIARLRALAASRAGDLPQAIAHWRRAAALDPSDLEAAFGLAQDLERLGGSDNETAAARVLEVAVQRSSNLALLLELARLSAKRGDAASLARAIDALTRSAAAWSPEAQARLRSVREAAARGATAATTPVIFLKNVLLPTAVYRTALGELTAPMSEVGAPLMRLVVLPNPPAQPAAADTSLTFAPSGGRGAALEGTTWTGTMSLEGATPIVMAASAREVRLASGAVLPFPSGATAVPPGPHAVAAVDLNYDFRTDLVLAGAGGLRIHRQGDEGTFADVTARAALPAATTAARLEGVWVADLDTDGDLDLVIAPADGPPQALRNNGDDSFALSTPFAGVARLRGFVWADIDGEGVPDAAILDGQGMVRLFVSLRGGAFRELPAPAAVPSVVAIAAAEVTGDGLLDVVGLTAAGSVVRHSVGPDGRLAVGELARAGSGNFPPLSTRLLTADLDNNAAADLVASDGSTTRVLLGGPGGSFTPLAAALDTAVGAAADLDGDGRLDLVGGTARGATVTASRGQRRYHWQAIRPRAASATGDQRINAFGIGGEVEIRSALHAQKQPIISPIVHFGLGEALSTDVARITWPNGVLQSEFALAADTAIAASQRLKGSCPWLFAWNGRDMAFVTDFIWRSPLGLRINAQATADVLMTEDWVKIPGDRLVARNGAYELRITAELWETHFFDLVSLRVVDHPAGTELYVDERFAVPAPTPALIVTTAVRPFASVRDDRGGAVDAVVAARDDRHLDFAGRGPYQGVTRDHYIELELPEEAPSSGPLWLVGQGWIHPTDSSLNVALGQGAHAAPRGLSISVADARGRFRPARSGLGFPAGKDKTVLLDLSGLFPPTGRRRLRLHTNLEIFWDRLGWAARPAGETTPPVAERRIPLSAADLRYRGYSVTEQKDAATPERPRYALAGTAPRWRDLEGFHTRFGDVRELVAAVDDRYVIMNAGDEIALTFPEAPPVAAGMVRDFVLVGDGWVKDGDYNTIASRTVLPLPTHQTPRYDPGSGRLQDDPVYRRHSADFHRYHTRYVSPEAFRDALRRPQHAGVERR